MKFPLIQSPEGSGHVFDANGERIPLHLLSTLTELIRRANAVDPLLETLGAYIYGCPDDGFGVALYVKYSELKT